MELGVVLALVSDHGWTACCHENLAITHLSHLKTLTWLKESR